MTRAIWAGLFLAFVALLSSVARAEEAPAEYRLSPSGKLRFIPAPNAMPAAELLAQTGDEDREWVARDTGVDYDGVTDVYVTLDEVGFLAKQPVGRLAPSWASGVAYPDLNRIVLKLGPKERNPRAILRHELSHISIGRLTKFNAPRWFLEGIAMNHSGDSWNSEGPSLMRAVIADRLFRFDDLTRGFPSGPSDAELAYAQSADFVKYLSDRFGDEKLHEVLQKMVAGAGFDEAVITVMGTAPSLLEKQWRSSLSRWEMVFRLMASYEFILGLTVVLALVAWWKIRRRKQLRLLLLEREEQAEQMRELLRAPAMWADTALPETESELVGATAPEAGVTEDEDFDDSEFDEDDLPDEIFARSEPTPPKKPTLH